MSELARVLKGCRQRAGLSLRAVAERAGISHSYVAKLETAPAPAGPSSPTVQTLVRLAKALGAPLSLLLEAAVADAGGEWSAAQSPVHQPARPQLQESPPPYAAPLVHPALPPELRRAYERDRRLLAEFLDHKYGLDHLASALEPAPVPAEANEEKGIRRRAAKGDSHRRPK